MIEKILYGPIEILPPTTARRAILEIDGIAASDTPYTTYVFLDDLHGKEIEELIRTKNYAGRFSIDRDSSETLRMDITQALNIALEIRPNFHISFLSRCENEHGLPMLEFKQLHIHKTPAMDTQPVTHTITPESFFKEVASQ